MTLTEKSPSGTVYHFHAGSTKPAAATYKQTNRQTAQGAREAAGASADESASQP